MHGLEDLQKMHIHSTSLLVLCTHWWVGDVISHGHGIADMLSIRLQ